MGIVTLRDALMMAQQRGLDLVEIAPNATPPVCRMLEYGKYRYEQGKKERERNMVLKDKYSVSGFPTVLVMSPQGEEVGRTGYQPGGPERFIKDVQAYIDQHKKAAEQKAGAEQK